jgi:carboxyl-terminal processing protease
MPNLKPSLISRFICTANRSKWVVLGGLTGFFVGVALSATDVQKEPKLPVNEVREMANVYGLIRKVYIEDVDDKKLMRGAISGMLYDLDPHSAYFDEKSLKELTEATKGEFGGLGIEIGVEDDFIKVISPIEDTPAEKAGIQAGDLITKINETSTKNISTSEAAKKMRGAPGTSVTITISRKNETRPIVLTITRAIIKSISVKGKLVEPDYAWVRVTQFQEPTLDLLVTKLEDLLKQEPNLNGVVLDLRNNPGGLIQSAVGISSIFLPKDSVVVETRGRDITNTSQLKADLSPSVFKEILINRINKLREKLKSVNVVVLVNSGSASASEVVSGALQDWGRATIMGDTTFGKASVQTIIPLDEKGATALKLTTARYYTPKGRSIQAKGIEPDLRVDETENGNIFSQNIREVDIDKHLKNEQGMEAEKVQIDKAIDEIESFKQKQEKDKQFKRPDFGSDQDWQLKQALNHLKHRPVVLSKTPKKEVATSASSAKPQNHK